MARRQGIRAHDVRALGVCCKCDGLGATKLEVAQRLGTRPLLCYGARWYAHAGCIVTADGLEALLQYPEAELNKVTLGEVGAVKLRLLIDELDRRAR